jgi:hypothetical protein
VQNAPAFSARYGAGLPVAGTWPSTKRLSNGGDHLTLLDRSSAPIRDFSYDDSAPWPVEPDGAGRSLTLINPASNPDHSLPASWRASSAIGGSPGAPDIPSPLLPPDPLSYLARRPQCVIDATGATVIRWTEAPDAADRVRFIPEASDDLAHWVADPGDQSLFALVSTEDSPQGRTITLRPPQHRSRFFFRLKVEAR